MNSDSISSNHSSESERLSSEAGFKSTLSEKEKQIQKIAAKEIKEKSKKSVSSKVPVERQRIPPAQEHPQIKFSLPPIPTEPPPLLPVMKQFELKIQERIQDSKPFLLKQDVKNILARSTGQFDSMQAIAALKVADSCHLSFRRAIYYSIAEGFLPDHAHLLKNLGSVHNKMTLDKSAFEFYCEVWRVLAEKDGAYTIDALNVEKNLPEKFPFEDIRELAHETISSGFKNMVVEHARDNKIDEIADDIYDENLLPTADLPPEIIESIMKETKWTLEAEELDHAIPQVFEQLFIALREEQDESLEKIMERKAELPEEFVAAAGRVQAKEKARPENFKDPIYEWIKAGTKASNWERLTEDVKALLSLTSLDAYKCRQIALGLQKWAEEDNDSAVKKEVFQSVARAFLPDHVHSLFEFAKIDLCPSEFLQEAGKTLAGFDRQYSSTILNNAAEFRLETADQLLKLLQIVAEKDGTAVLDYLGPVEISSVHQLEVEEIKARAIETWMERCYEVLPECIAQNNSALIPLPHDPLPSSVIQELIQIVSFNMPQANALLCEALMTNQKESLLKALDETIVSHAFLHTAANILMQDATAARFLLMNLDKFQLQESELADILIVAASQYRNTFVALINELKLPERLSQLSSRIEVASRVAGRKNKSWVLQHLDLFGIAPKERALLERHLAQVGDLGRLRTIVKKRVLPLAKGLQEGAKPMQASYWLEQTELKIKVGNETYQGHFHPESFEQAFKKWHTEGYSKQYSFENYLNQLYIPSLTAYGLQLFVEKLRPVHYFNDQELATLAPRLQPDGSIQMPNGYLAQWTQYMQLGMNQEYRAYLATAPAPPKTTTLPSGDYIFTVGRKGEFHIAWKAGNINHSSLTSGTPSKIAGTLHLEEKAGRTVITRIIPWSGHYQPDIDDIEDMRLFFEQQGVDTKKMEFQLDFDGKVILSYEQFKQKIDQEKSRMLSRIKGYSPAAFERATSFTFKQLQTLEREIPSEAHAEIGQLADQLYPHLEPLLGILGYKPEEIRPFVGVFASDLFPMLANPEGHQGDFSRSVKKAERRFLRSDARFEKVKIPFTFVTSLKGNQLHLQIIPNTKQILGEGSYGKVKSTYTLSLEVSPDKRPGAIQLDQTVIKRIVKGRETEVLASLSTVRQMADRLDSTVKIVIPRLEREYDSKTGTRRVELEMDHFQGSLDAIAKKEYGYSSDETKMRLSCLLDVAESIAAMHAAGYLHLDLKTENVLVKQEADGSVGAYTGDFDFVKKGMGAFREHPTYAFYDRLGQKGFGTHSCDIYGLAALAGEVMIPDFYKQVLQDRGKIYTDKGRASYTMEMLTEKALHDLQIAGFTEAELAPLLLRKATSVETLFKAIPRSNLDEKKRQALEQYEKESRSILEVFQLYCEVAQAEQRWNKAVSSDPELQRKILAGTDKEKQEVLEKMKTFFPNLLAGDIAKRVRDML